MEQEDLLHGRNYGISIDIKEKSGKKTPVAGFTTFIRREQSREGMKIL